MGKKFTIGYISHNKECFEKFLLPSIRNLRGDFDLISASDKFNPAHNYNKILELCQTEYLILTHQDVTFSPDLLGNIENTIQNIEDDWGVLGMVGVNTERKYLWSRPNTSYFLDTADCCFIIIRKSDSIKFDEKTFDDYHLYVEDYCAQVSRILGKKIRTILINSSEAPTSSIYDTLSYDYLRHHSYTIAKRGFAWGRYYEYRQRLELKWPGIKTT